MSDSDHATRLQNLEAQVAQLSAQLASLTAVFVEEASLSSGMPNNIIEGKLTKARERLAKPPAPAIPRRL